jgi:hypothetical protein
MKTNNISKSLKLILGPIAMFLVMGCPNIDDVDPIDKNAPTITLTGDIASGYLTTTAGTKVNFAWTAKMGTAKLSTISIEMEGNYIEGWDNTAIADSESKTYTNTISISMPGIAGEYSFTITVTDVDGGKVSKSVIVKVEKPVVTIDDCFVYFENSTFLFVIKDGKSTIKTTMMEWTVTSYNSSTQVATINCTLDPSGTQTPLPSTFYFRKATSGALEYSSNGSTWENLTDKTGDLNFLFGTKAAKPSSLLGDVDNGIEATTVSYPEGSSAGYKVFSEYGASGNDSYMFSDYTKEFYSIITGFTKSISYYYEGKDYPPTIYKREVELVNFKIHLPDGTTIEGGNAKPEAPSDLKGSYTHRKSVWNSSTGMYEKRSYITLRWTDNSEGEIQFDVYIQATDGNYYRLSEITNAVLKPDNFPANTFSGMVKKGYYVDWGSGTYYFKLKAVSATDESEFSNAASVTVN